MSRIFGNKPTPTRRWQLGLTVTPPEASATIVVNRLESRGVRQAGSGHVIFSFSTPEFTPGTVGTLVVEAPGYIPWERALASIGPPNRELNEVTLVRAFDAVLPLVVRGKHFCTSDDEPFFLKHSSQFLAMLRWKRGEDLQPLIDWSHDVGCEGWRIFGQWHNPPNPADRFGPDALSAEDIRQFAVWLIDKGLRPEICTLTDCGDFGMSHGAQRQRVQDVKEALAGLSVLNSLCNEPMINGCDVYRICDDLNLWDKANRPVLMATGDYGIAEQHEEKTFRALDYVGEHPERGWNWPAELGKKGHFVYDGWDEVPSWKGFRGQDVAVYIEEPRGADEFDHGSRDSNPDNFEDAAGAAKVGSAGYCFHSQAGLEAVVPGPVTTECARRSYEAIERFPNDAWGDYKHNELGDNPLEPIMDCTEVISSIVGNRAYSVVTQIGPTAEVRAWAGWRIVKQEGARRNFVTLER